VTLEDVISDIIRREDGYVFDPADRGKATKYGITQATLAKWRGHDVTPDDVATLLEPEARAIYRKWYVEDPGFDAFADPVRWVMVDLGVLHGPTNAVMMLQRAMGDTNPDGKLGPVTLTIAKAIAPDRLARLLLAQRAEFFGKLIAHDPTQAKFAYGWLRERVSNLLRAIA